MSTTDRTYFGPDLERPDWDRLASGGDPGKLKRLRLPQLRSEREVADWLKIPLSRLRWFTHDLSVDCVWHYVRFTLPKRRGGERVVLAPKAELKALQRKVLHEILDRVPVSDPAHGFVRRRSIATNAQPHEGKAVVLNLDLKDFFPSITFARVRGFFQQIGYGYSVAAVLALLCTEHDREAYGETVGDRYYAATGPRHLVQGAPTSPALANLIAFRLDRRLAGLAKKHGFSYTRYADDLTFSGDSVEKALRILDAAQYVIAAERFEVNKAKTRIFRRSGRQVVTGLVVNEKASVPRKVRKLLRAILHNARQTGLDAQNRDNRPDFYGYLAGMIGHVNAANPQHAAPLLEALREIL